MAVRLSGGEVAVPFKEMIPGVLYYAGKGVCMRLASPPKDRLLVFLDGDTPFIADTPADDKAHRRCPAGVEVRISNGGE